MVDKEMLDAFPSKDKTQTGALHPGPRSPHGKAMSPEAERLRTVLDGYIYEDFDVRPKSEVIAGDIVAELGITEEMVERMRFMVKERRVWPDEVAIYAGIDTALSALLEVANS